MASVNKVILVGNLGRDPEVRYMASGEAVCNFSIATTDTWKDKNGQKQERTEWHNIVMYRRLAEIAGEYLKKGRPVYIEGRLQTRKWQDKNGQDRYTTEIIADQMQMLGGRDSSGMGGGYDAAPPMMEDNGYHAMRDDTPPARPSAPPPAPRRQAPAPISNQPANFDDMDDDIPF